MIIKSKDIEKIPLNKHLAKIDFKKKESHYYKVLFALLFNWKIYIYVLFFLSYLLYYKSLEKCTKGEDKCPRKINWIKAKIKEVIFSCLVMVVLFELIIYKKISRLHLIHIILCFIMFYSYSHGLNFQNHGYYNFKGYFILFIIFFVLFLPINFLIYLIQKKKKKYWVIIQILKEIQKISFI
jgi:hypothetical protein